MSLLAVSIPYWGQSLLRVLGVLVVVLLPAGTLVYLFLFKMMSFMQSRLGPDGGRAVRLAAAVRRGRQVHPEGGHQPRRGADLRIFRMAPYVVVLTVFLIYVAVPVRARRRASPTSRSASSTCWPCRASRCSACSWPAGPAPTSTR